MDLSDYKEVKPRRLRRIMWAIINATLFRLACGRLGWPVRRGLLRAFGAVIDRKAYIYSRCKIFAPWQLSVGRACIGPGTELYNKASITIGDDSVISQGSFLCTSSHDITSTMLPLVSSPIVVDNYVWIGANVFIGPGVTLNEGVVVGATASVYKDVEAWNVVGGNPAKVLKKRILKAE